MDTLLNEYDSTNYIVRWKTADSWQYHSTTPTWESGFGAILAQVPIGTAFGLSDAADWKQPARTQVFWNRKRDVPDGFIRDYGCQPVHISSSEGRTALTNLLRCTPLFVVVDFWRCGTSSDYYVINGPGEADEVFNQCPDMPIHISPMAETILDGEEVWFMNDAPSALSVSQPDDH